MKVFKTRACLDCCDTFSASSFVTPYTQSFLHGAVLRRHTEPCFAVYCLYIYTHITVVVWHSDRLHEAGRGVRSLAPSTVGESTVTTDSFFSSSFSPNVTSIFFLNEEEKNEEKNARTGLSEKAAKLASSGVWH